MNHHYIGLLSLTAVACTQPPAKALDGLIGGEEATGPAYAAIGTIGMMDDGAYSFYCTATLVGPHTVLTAKHCAVNAYLPTDRVIDGERVYFGLGDDARAPIRIVEAVSVTMPEVSEEGFLSMGADVALYTLVEPIDDVEPMSVRLSAFDENEVGTEATAVGFGVENAEFSAGARKRGQLEIIAVEGQPLRALFPTLDAFVAYMAEDAGQAFVDDHQERIADLYATELYTPHEIWTHGQGVQPCHGDSGGPLLVEDDGPRIGAVVSGGIDGKKQPCIAGELYATFAPDTAALIEAAIADPCAGLPDAGRCLGNTAVRCEEQKLVIQNCTDEPTDGYFPKRCVMSSEAASCRALF